MLGSFEENRATINVIGSTSDWKHLRLTTAVQFKGNIFRALYNSEH